MLLDLSFFALLLALIWGIVYALFLQRTAPGKFLAARYTWLSVVVGCGVDLLLARLVMGSSAWMTLMIIFALSGIPIVVRSLINDWRDQQALLRQHEKNTHRQ